MSTSRDHEMWPVSAMLMNLIDMFLWFNSLTSSSGLTKFECVVFTSEIIQSSIHYYPGHHMNISSMSDLDCVSTAKSDYQCLLNMLSEKYKIKNYSKNFG